MVQEGMNLLLPSQFNNREVQVDAVGEDADPWGMEDGTAVSLNQDPPGDIGSWTTLEELRQAADPREIHRNRSQAAREADRAKDAPITTNPLEWASDPDAKDFPGVDTGPTFRDEQGAGFDTEGFLNDLF